MTALTVRQIDDCCPLCGGLARCIRAQKIVMPIIWVTHEPECGGWPVTRQADANGGQR